MALLSPTDPVVCLLIDLQDRLVPAIAGADRIVDRAGRLVDAARLLGWPVRATEHAADRIGPSVPPLRQRLAPEERIAKRHFDAFAEADLENSLPATHGPSGEPVTLLIAGTEAHVCVALTAVAAQDRGFRPVVVADAVGSRDPANRQAALDALRARGIEVWPLETLLFAGLAHADHAAFREMLDLIRPLVAEGDPP